MRHVSRGTRDGPTQERNHKCRPTSHANERWDRDNQREHCNANALFVSRHLGGDVGIFVTQQSGAFGPTSFLAFHFGDGGRYAQLLVVAVVTGRPVACHVGIYY